MKGYRAHLYVLCALAAAMLSGADSLLFHALTDARFAWFPRAATGNVVLVAVDPRSIKDVGVWPWPRTLHADLIRKLGEAGASEIVFDIDFSSRATATSDAAFLSALKAAGGSVILPSFVQNVSNERGQTSVQVTNPPPEFRASSWPATANYVIESDGLARRYSHGAEIEGSFVPSIGALLAGAYDTRANDFIIDYSIRTETLPVLSFADVLARAVRPEQLAGKKIIVGATAVELGDRITVPNGHVIPGPMLQALATESLLQKRALQRTGTLLDAAGLVGLALLVMALWRRLSNVRLGVVLVGTAIVIELLATALQVKAAILLDTSLWHLAIMAYLAATFVAEIDIRGLMAHIAENRFRRIAMSLGDGLVCTDFEGRITFWNPGATQIFGFGRGDMIGKPLQTLIILDDRPSEPHQTALFSESATDVASFIVECTGKRKSGESFALEMCVSRWRSTDHFDYGFVLRDISARKREEERIRFLAGHDVLTGLANRTKLIDELQRILLTARPNEEEVAVLLLGLDRFKDLNDTLGQDRGDAIIRAVAQRLEQRVFGIGEVARTSGDEFAIVLPSSRTAASAAAIVATIADELKEFSIELDDRTINVAVSLGSAVFPEDGETAGDLMANATLALQDAKLHHRGGHVAYLAKIRTKIEDQRRLEKELHRAFAEREFELHYQPQVTLHDHKVVGAEALIRWRHPVRGLVSPGQFLAVLNTMPLSEDVGRWVIETAFRQARDWRDAGQGIRIGANLSPSQLTSPELPGIVAAALAANDLEASLVELEVTENILLDDGDMAAGILRSIRETGVEIAFDDFGTGYASLTHLKRMPLDRLKIDQTFVRNFGADPDDRAIVSAIVGLGRLLDMHVIAEGIEDLATADALAQMGCEEAQGYYFGRPANASEFFEKYLKNDAARFIKTNAEQARLIA
ncbi:MAG: EAL domain-containing protein [Hyphomicrobium sp.]